MRVITGDSGLCCVHVSSDVFRALINSPLLIFLVGMLYCDSHAAVGLPFKSYHWWSSDSTLKGVIFPVTQQVLKQVPACSAEALFFALSAGPDTEQQRHGLLANMLIFLFKFKQHFDC